MKKLAFIAMASVMLVAQSCNQAGKEKEQEITTETKMKTTMEKISPKDFTTFKVSENVDLYRVSFKNQYSMEVVGHLFIPKGFDLKQPHPAIIAVHPMGAVKEQSGDVYASAMADRGFVTLSIDQSFWGESEGGTRNAVLPDVYVENFLASVDFLGTREFVDKEKIGVIGVCGNGSFAVAAAKIDPRIKALATVSMYDMGAVTRNGLNKSQTLEQRKAMIAEAAQQRYEEFTTGKQIWRNYLPTVLPKDADPITVEFFDFYRTPRGIAIPKDRTLETTQNRTLSGEVKFVNFYPFEGIETISPRPVLFITGDQAHSKEFSEDAYARAAEPKELYYVKGANHVDLYDRTNIIPLEKLDAFFKQNLK